MRAVLCETLGGPENLVVRELDDPGQPGLGEVRVEVRAVGVAFSDTLMIRGEYQVKPDLPFVVGGEAGAVVTAIGEDVLDLAVGDNVLAGTGCVEHALVRAERVTKLPAGIDLEKAAGFRGNYHTALFGMQRANLQAEEVLLVHGAAGGVGMAAVDIGKLMGARVIATASTDEKLAVVQAAGADHCINYTDGFREEVKELTDGRGADVIYDPVGGDVFDESMRCVAPYGRILVVGFTSGRPALAKTNHLLIKDVSVIGYTLGGLSRHNPELAARNGRVLVDLLANRRIDPYVSHRLPMERAGDALQLITDRKVIGKAILIP